MAARRLLILMLILLGTSTLAAALVPTPAPREEETTETTTTSTSAVPTGGALVRASIDADAKRPERVRAELGDQLSILVRSRRAGQIEVKGLGLLEDVLPLSPARFDILAVRPGSFEIHFVEPDRRVAVLEVKG